MGTYEHSPSLPTLSPCLPPLSLSLSLHNIEITVGLQQTSYFALETGGPVSICAEMFDGTLERNVSLTLTSMDGNATGMYDVFFSCIILTNNVMLLTVFSMPTASHPML